MFIIKRNLTRKLREAIEDQKEKALNFDKKFRETGDIEYREELLMSIGRIHALSELTRDIKVKTK